MTTSCDNPTQTWDIQIESPMGVFDAQLAIDVSNENPSGEMRSKNGTGPMLELNLSENSLSWKTKIEKPMPLTMSFNGTVEDATVFGKVKFGVFASGKFSGKRI